jgi:hypothetical protein
MTQSQLNRAVARATGESVATIRRMGFTHLPDMLVEADRKPLVVDWDDLDAQRHSGFPHGILPHVAA